MYCVDVLHPVGFWEGITLAQLDAALAKGDRILMSSSFKTKAVFGYKSVQLTEELVAILQDYRQWVRPYCLPGGGVQSSVDSSPTAPLFLNPQGGGRMRKMSAKVEAFLFRVLGLHLNVTRIRSIMHTECATTQSSENLKRYEVSQFLSMLL
jgi:hypothetical protein